MSDTPTFNLIDQPWIPCIPMEGGSSHDLSLRQTLTGAPDLREIVDPSPLVTIALHRLLLAILHRTHGPATINDWRTLWERGRFDDEALNAYFDRWHGRFDLFDPVHPFYQTPGLETKDAKPVNEFVFGMTLGNYRTLFDHSTEVTPPALWPAEAARNVLAFHSFHVFGTIGKQSFEPPESPFKSAAAAPLNTAAAAVVRGGTLFETLLLNLHRYDGVHGQPFPFGESDCPAWERSDPIVVGPRQPDGYLDLLTWQSRRLLLLLESRNGHFVVRHVVIMNGSRFPKDWYPGEHESMVAYRENTKAKPDQDPWIPYSFSPERALWRDSSALYQSVAGHHRRPKMVNWLGQLLAFAGLASHRRISVDLYGMSTDQARILLWRHERLPLPPSLLDDVDRYQILRQALELAERMGGLFRTGFDVEGDGSGKPKKTPRPLMVLAEQLAAPLEGQSPRKEAVQSIATGLDPSAAWWARLDVPFRTFIRELGIETEDTDGQALWHWTLVLEQAARQTFDEVINGLGDSARALRAAAIARPAFNRRVRIILGPTLRPPSSAASNQEESAA